MQIQEISKLINDISVHACNGKCSKCGDCCTNFIPITKKEVKKIKKYVEENNIKAEKRIFENDIYMKCPFLDMKTKQCKIYEVRPFVCRDFFMQS